MENSLLSLLPRSVQWRIRLGIYQGTQEGDPTTTEAQLLAMVYQSNQGAIQAHNERFAKLVEEHVEEEVPESEVETHEAPASTDATTPQSAPEVDPLTAIVLEQDAIQTKKDELMLKYKKERARRKRGLTTEGNAGQNDESDGLDRASIIIIEKDLKRLPHPTSNDGAASANLSPAEEQRIADLKEVLYIYAQVHPTMGYRQGMHEIASYLMFVLELEKAKFPNNPLFEPILPLCYALLEKTLDRLHLAYDVSGEESLQQLSRAILGKIQQNDVNLYNFLASPSIPPPPIYCTRWVRLLFSREVVGYENVFQLWDVFFEHYDNLMRALEVTSAARILLLRNELLNPSNNPLDLLMNVPRLSDTSKLTGLLRQLMTQTETDPPVPLPIPPPMAAREPTNMPQIPLIPNPQSFLPIQPSTGSESPTKSASGGKSFSFSKMKQSLEKKGESWRKKIIVATNDWKKEGGGGAPSQDGSGGGGSDFFGSLVDPNRSNVYQQRTSTGINSLFADPLSAGPSAALPEPPSPRKHQHAKWSELLDQRIMIVQQFLMSVEAKEQDGIPKEVWEAMADMQRMQHELLNYSRTMT